MSRNLKQIVLALTLGWVALSGWGEELVLKAQLNRANGDWSTVGIQAATGLEVHLKVSLEPGKIRLFLKDSTFHLLMPTGQRSPTRFSIVSMSSSSALQTSMLTANEAVGSKLSLTNVNLGWETLLFTPNELENTPFKNDFIDYNPDAPTTQPPITLKVQEGAAGSASVYYVQIGNLQFAYKRLFRQWWKDVPDFETKGMNTLWRAIARGSSVDQATDNATMRNALIDNTDPKGSGILPETFVTEFSRLMRETFAYDQTRTEIGFPKANLYWMTNNPLSGSGFSLTDRKDLAGNAAKYFFTGKMQTVAANENVPGGDFLGQDWTKKLIPAGDSNFQRVTLSMRKTGDSTAYKIGTKDFFFATPAVNVLRLRNLVNLTIPEEDMKKVLWEQDSTDVAPGLTGNSWSFSWDDSFPVAIKTLTLWTNAANLTASQLSFLGDGGINLGVSPFPEVPGLVLTEIKATGTGGWESGKGTGARHFYVVTFVIDRKISSLTVQYDPTKPPITMYKVSAHQGRPESPVVTTAANAPNDYLIRSNRYSITDLFVVTALAPEPYFAFWDIGYGKEKDGPGNKPLFDESAHPISYAWGGWETPRSYTLKVNTNGRTTGFPRTELDIKTNNGIDHLGIYRSLDLSLKQNTGPYPFTFGLRMPQYSPSTLLNTNSPFFVEKWAGVDSWGLLQSLLWKAAETDTALKPWQQASALERWNWRTKGYNATQEWAVTQVFPFRSDTTGLGWYNSALLTQWTTSTEEWLKTNTEVVGSLPNMKVGNLLVGYEGTELVTAIILEVPAGLSSPKTVDGLREWMKRTKVAVISRALSALTYSTWAEFTPNPEEYHVRTLKIAKESQELAFQSVLDPSAKTERGVVFLPNTELVVPIGALASGTADPEWPAYSGRLITSLPTIDSPTKKNAQWDILRAEDYGFDTARVADTDNLYNNRQTTFYLVASKGAINENGIRQGGESGDLVTAIASNPQFVVLAKISRPASPTNNQLLVTWLKDDPRYYSGSTVNLLADKGNLFVQVIRNKTSSAYPFFGVVAENPFPGDDLQITFGFRGQAVLTTGRMVVIDHKMLWRANLYIDEGSGDLDWNNRHPWVTGNEWNRDSNGMVVTDLAKQGRQNFKVRPFTESEQSLTVMNNPGYYIFGYDSPFDFNQKLDQQKQLLAKKWVFFDTDNSTTTSATASALNQRVDQWGDYMNQPLEALYSATFDQATWKKKGVSGTDALVRIRAHMNKWASGNQVYGTTTAPLLAWANYIQTAPAGTAPFPYRPFVDGDSATPQDQRGRYIGVDCVGFLQRSAYYSGSPYTWVAINSGNEQVDWSTNRDRGLRYPMNDGALVAESKGKVEPQDLDPVIPELTRVLPGDLVVFYYPSGGVRHLAMVQSVLPNADGRVPLSGITLIESTHRQRNGSVNAITGPYNQLSMKDYERRRYESTNPPNNPDTPYGVWAIYHLDSQ